MLVTLLVLFFSAVLGGVAVRFFEFKSQGIKGPLIFAGSFLFSITIIHILPEVFASSDNTMMIGLLVLAGFFFQQFLEYFTNGIEHGHTHIHHHMGVSSGLSLLLALVIHSVLEGALLTHHSPFHDQHESHSLLIGIVLHKMPAAFALVTTLRSTDLFKSKVWLILFIFSIASPLGLLFGDYVLVLPKEQLYLLFAFVSGSFLHISTTIFVESSPNHHFGLKKLLISLAGASVAILTEYLL